MKYTIFDVNNLDVQKANNVALGNSLLELLFVSDKHQIEMAKTIYAVINEMPTISISSEWKDSPMTSIGQKLSNFLQNPIIDTVAQQSENYQKLTLTDEYSKKFYNGISDLSFDVSFRLYQDSFFKTTNPIIAFNNIINAILPKKTFDFFTAYQNIENAFKVSTAAGTKVINTISDAYTNLSSITDANGGNMSMTTLDNLASDINSALSNIAKNQAIGNDYFLIKLGYNILGFAYPLEVVCTNCNFTFSKQTWYNSTQGKYQPYYIDFDMSFVTLCTPSLNTWKKYINGTNDPTLNNIQEKNIVITKSEINTKDLSSSILNNMALSYLKNKTGLDSATKDNVQTANDIYTKLKNTIISGIKDNKNSNYTPTIIVKVIQQSLQSGTFPTDLASQLDMSNYKDYFTIDKSGNVSITNTAAIEVINNIDTSTSISNQINTGITATNAALGKRTYGNSNAEITNSNDLSKQISIINGVIQTNNAKSNIPLTFE